MKILQVLSTSAASGKTISMLGLVRALVQAGLKVAVFKPVSEDRKACELPDGDVSLTALHLMAAADMSPTGKANPVLLLPQASNQAEVWLLGRYVGTVSRLGRDMPLLDELPAAERDEVERVTLECLEEVAADADIVIAEGSGGASDLTLLQSWDLANVVVPRQATAAILIARASNGGAIASLAGTVPLLPDDIRCKIRGLVLTDVCHRQRQLVAAGENLALQMGKTFVGTVPYIYLPKGWQQREPYSSKAEDIYLTLARGFQDSINVSQMLDRVGTARVALSHPHPPTPTPFENS